MATNLDVRGWLKLHYYDPVDVLPRLAELGASEIVQSAPYKVASLRTKGLRVFHERRLGAIYFYLMGRVENCSVKFAHVEQADYDFVGHFMRGDTHHFVPVQMKELVPDFLNPAANLQGVVDSIRAKYVDSSDLTVAIALNRTGRIDLKEVDFSGLKVRGLYLFGSDDQHQRTWTVIGNVLEPNGYALQFEYPSKGK